MQHTAESSTVLVTGGGSERGIGRATARRLAAAGRPVAIFDIDADGAARAARAIADEYQVPALGLGVDVTDAAAIHAAVSKIEAELPPVLALANVAGTSSPTPFAELTLGEWDRVFATNTRSAFLVSQRVLPAMIEHRFGRIVTVSSISAQRGGGTYSTVAYSAAKAALMGFTRALAREVGRSGITVNCVAPGPIDTDIMGGPLTDERKAAMSADTMVGRVGTVADVAGLIWFLLGPDSGFITAATYDINGGLQVS